MKNVAFAGALAAALCLSGVAQRASAQYCPPQCVRGGDVSFNMGFTFGCHWTPSHGHWEPNCCNPGCCPGCGYYGAPYPVGYAAPFQGGYGPYAGFPGAAPDAAAPHRRAPAAASTRDRGRAVPPPARRRTRPKSRTSATATPSTTTATITPTAIPITRMRTTGTAAEHEGMRRPPLAAVADGPRGVRPPRSARRPRRSSDPGGVVLLESVAEGVTSRDRQGARRALPDGRGSSQRQGAVALVLALRRTEGAARRDWCGH